MKHSIYSYIWLLPFVICCIGYSIPWYFMPRQSVVTPSVVGLSLHDATLKISQAQLTVIIKREELRSDLPANIVVEQTPLGGSMLRVGQSIQLITVAPKQNIFVPDFLKKTMHEAADWAQNLDVSIKFVWIESNRPTGEIIAQYPRSNTILQDASIKIYVSHGQPSLFIIPTLCNAKPIDIMRSFERNGLKFECVQENGLHIAPNINHVISGQSPIAGSIIDVNKKITMQLSVRSLNSSL